MFDHTDKMVRIYHTLFVIAFMWMCSSVPVIQGQNATNTTESRPGKLVWTELNTNSKRARINSLPIDPASYINSPSIATTGFYESTPAHWIAISSDYDDRLVFWTDAARKRIMKGGLGDGATAAPVFTGTSQTVDGIAVDWLANNIYWADGSYDWIILTNYNASRYRVLIDTEVDKPRGMTLYPQQGYLFWSDWGDTQKIERSNLAGENRTLIADTGLHYPNGLAVDFATDKLYWVDADPSGSRIEVTELDGTNRATLFTISQGQGHLFDLAVFGEYIFVTDWHEQMRCIRKAEKDQYFALNVGARPFGITVYAPDSLPGDQSPCDSNPCEHLCVSDGPGYKCLCIDNYQLKDDGSTCEIDVDGLTMPQILLASKTSLCNFPANFADMNIQTEQTVNCFLNNRSFSVAIELDIPSRLLFYSDFEKKTIERVRLLQGESVDTIRGGIGSVEGIAVDWLSQNIYWTDALYHHIAVSRYDGQHRNIIVKDNVIKPRSIVIHAGLRMMFWTEFGPPGHIEIAGLDGKDRDILVSGLTSPNGLTIDFVANRLYYSDRLSGSVDSIDFDGGNKRTLYTRQGAQYFDMTIFKDYFIWTEWNTFNGIHAMNRENGRVTQSLRIATSVYGVKAFAAERQPGGASVCGTDNGGCDHLCLPRLNAGYRCECGTGFTLAGDGHTCTTNIASDGFLLATDSFLHGIVQMYIDDPVLDFTTLDLGPMTNPIAVDYDPVDGRVYWSDVKEQKVYRAFMNGTGKETITGPGYGIRVDGIAIDRVSRLIYWTDADSNTTSVARLDGSKRKTLLSENLDQPRAIALDLANGYMYWSDWGDNPRIERAYMDGTNRTTIVDSGLGWPNGIALDLTENYIYWCDALTNKIERSSFTGDNRTVVVDFGDIAHKVHPFGLAVHGSYIYWTDWRKRSLMKANKADGSRNGTIGPNEFIRLNSIRVYSAAEDITTTVCSPDNGGCSSLCIPTPDGAVCACQDGDSLSPDGQTCWGDMSCDRVIPHGNISSECGMDGACVIVCDEGYNTGAISMTATCQASGEWDIDTADLCQVVTCEALSIPLDATARPCPSPHVYATTCVFQCDRGWEVESGDEQRTCQADGMWTGTDLVCQMVMCDPLEPPEYGSFSNSNCSTVGGYYNDLCIAQCQDGFQLLGITERGCLGTGEWTDADANSTCIDLTLPVFNSTCEDQDVTALRGQVRANVSYETPTATDNSGKPVNIWSRRDEYLNPPIEMDEGEYIMTFYAQDWVQNTAGCTFVVTVHVQRCPDLEDPESGYYDNCQTHYGASCNVICNEGFNLKGDEVQTCELDDTGKPAWSAIENPTCHAIICDEAQVGSNVFKAGCTPPYNFGTECVYMCQPGYIRQRGSTSRQCQSDSTWDGNPLECEIQHCGPLSAVEHGTIYPPSCTLTGGDYGDVCNVTCEEGYRLVGADENRCLETGRWSNAAEDSHFCIDSTEPHFNDTCPVDFPVYTQMGEQDAVVTWTLHIVDNSQFNVTSTRESGSRFAEGTHTVIVTATDIHGNIGECEFIVTVIVVRCPKNRNIPYMVNNCNTTHYGSRCTYACDEGFELIGNASRTCNRDHQGDTRGQWSDRPPRCKAVTCPGLFDLIGNLRWVVRNSRRCNTDRKARYGTRCSLECKRGFTDYSGITPMYAQCAQSGQWTFPDNNTCTLATCDPAIVDDKLIQTPADCLNNRGNYGDACQLSCPEGYRQVGPTIYYCNMENKWRTKGPMPDQPVGRPGRRRPSMLPWIPLYNPGTEVSENENGCVDILQPVFDEPCPRETTLTVAPCQNSTVVRIEKPTATDNSGNVTVLGPGNSIRELHHGVHTLSYVASDDAGNLAYCNITINVILVTCVSRIPQQDDVASLSCDNQYGSVATYACPEGQRPRDTDQPVTCGTDGEWTGQVPDCEDITCGILQPPSHGAVNPPKCNQGGSGMVAGSSCFIICDTGYGYKGESKHTCQFDGTWNRDVGSCIDVQPPVFTSCPNGIDVSLQPGQNQTTFNWPIPVAIDNSGEVPVVKNAERVTPPLTMEPGYRIMQYVATDSVGNSDYCIFTVTVRDTEAPKVKTCPRPKIVSVSSIPVQVDWIEPMFTDNIAITKVTKNGKPGLKLYSWGRHTVTYIAQDAAGNEAQCMVFIDVVDSTTCIPLRAPSNGALACENNNRLCSVHCNRGFAFTDKNKPQSAYRCQANGFWDFGDGMAREPNLPACSQVIESNPVNWQRKDKVQFELHHLDGNCEDVEQQIQQKFQQLLRSSAFMDYCRQDPNNNCKVDNVEVQCGDTGKKGRRRRQTDAAQQQDELLSLIYNLFGQRNNSEEIDALLTAMNMSISDVFGDSNITLIIDGEQVILSNQGGESGDIQVACEVNQTLADNGLTCVDCPLGTKYSLAIGDCISCPTGQYQDVAGQRSCKYCPQYTSTASQGATVSSLCRDMCSPGEYSPSGLVPCQKCPKGTHQQSRGSKGCTPCPEGMTTRTTGATTAFQCSAKAVVPTEPVDVNTIRTTTPPVQSQSTQTKTESAGKIDITSSASSVVITKVFHPNTGHTILTSKATPRAQKNKSGTDDAFPYMFIAVGAGAFVFLLLVGICVAVVMRRHRRIPYGARPLSWNGSEGGGILSDDEDEHDGDDHAAGYHQLEESPDYTEAKVDGDKRYYAANAIANPAYEPTFATFKDTEKDVPDAEDEFDDTFHIFSPSGPLNSVDLN